MAIAKLGTDTTTTYASSSVWNFNWSHTLVAGSNRLIIVSVGGETTLADTSPIWYSTSVTYGGQAMTQAVVAQTTETASGFSNNSSAIWYILEANLPATGLRTVQVNGTGPNSSVELFGICSLYEGVLQDVPEATNGNFINSPSGNVISNAISPTAGAWVISSYVSGNTGTWTVSGSQVEIYDNQQTTTSFGSCELRGAIGSETSLSSTASGANRLTRVAASFRPMPWKINTVTKYKTDEVNTTPIANIAKINTYITT
jgi:hypothetical protein